MNDVNKKSLMDNDKEVVTIEDSNKKLKQDNENILKEQLTLFERDAEDIKKKYSLTAEKNKSLKTNSLKTNISKGDILEYRVKRLLFYMGYFPKVGILLKTGQDNYADTITDLDVYGIYIHKDFRLTTIWADCKAGAAKPLERISWINGVKDTAHIHEVIFVKDGVRASTQNFARKHDIRVLETKMIEKLEKDFNIASDDWRGSWNTDNQLNQIANLQKIGIPEVDSYKRIGNYISCDYWTCDKYSKVKKSITALRQLEEAETFPLNETQNLAVKWAIFELITLFTLALFEICRELYFFNEKDKQNTILEGLLSGEISINMRNKIVDATYKTAYSIIKQHIPDFQGKIETPNLGMNPPTYANAFCDLINRITNEPLAFYDLLRMLDFMFMEYDLKNCDIDKDEMKNLFPNYDNLAISAKTILHFICNATKLRKDLFGLFK